MQIASICIGDTLVSLLQVRPLLADPDFPCSYELLFRDIVTHKTGVIVTESEGDAMLLLATWIIADEVGDITEAHIRRLERLKKQLPRDFLP